MLTDAAAIPPPSMLASQPTQKAEEMTGGVLLVEHYYVIMQIFVSVVQSALEELSRKKAQRKANPFGKPKL